MSLLSNADKTEIRNAVKLVTDTFFVTPITYKLAGESLDRWQEDRKDQKFTTYNLLGIVSYPMDKVQQTDQGRTFTADVIVTFNMKDLIALSLITADKVAIFNPNKDMFICNGQTYIMNSLWYSGPLDQENVLVKIAGDLTIKKT